MISLEPVTAIMFYIGLLTVSQYVDSVPAIFFGVPGETSAIPAAYEGPKLRDQGLAEAAVKLTAIGRIMAGLVSVTLVAMTLPLILGNVWIFSNSAQILLLTAAVIGVGWSSRSPAGWTLLSMLLGYGLGTVGFHPATGQNWLTFGNINLEAGIPLIVVLMGIYVVPVMLKSFKDQTNIGYRLPPQSRSTVDWWRYRWVMLRSSVAGWAVGLIPGLSYVLSSTVCYNWEKIRQMRQGTYQPGNMHTIVAAETGNTAGAVSTVIPLVVFGIPITASESIIYDIMVMNGAHFAQGAFAMLWWPEMLVSLVVASIVGIVLSWPLARHTAVVFAKINPHWLWSSLLMIILAVVASLGWYNAQLSFYLTAFALMCLLGLVLANRADPVPAMFMFVMQESIDQAIFNAVQFM
jgi:putative tricarboxylic transport membrane protein